MLIVSGSIHVDEHARSEYLVGCVDVMEKARAAQGCLDFVLAADLLDSTRINVYERWVSDADLDEALILLALPASSGFNWSGYQSEGSVHKRFDHDGFLGPDDGGLAIVSAADEFVGSVG